MLNDDQDSNQLLETMLNAWSYRFIIIKDQRQNRLNFGLRKCICLNGTLLAEMWISHYHKNCIYSGCKWLCRYWSIISVCQFLWNSSVQWPGSFEWFRIRIWNANPLKACAGWRSPFTVLETNTRAKLQLLFPWEEFSPNEWDGFAMFRQHRCSRDQVWGNNHSFSAQGLLISTHCLKHPGWSQKLSNRHNLLDPPRPLREKNAFPHSHASLGSSLCGNLWSCFPSRGTKTCFSLAFIMPQTPEGKSQYVSSPQKILTILVLGKQEPLKKHATCYLVKILLKQLLTTHSAWRFGFSHGDGND